MRETFAIPLAALMLGITPAAAQEPVPCPVVCSPELEVEPTVTFSNLFGSPRIVRDDGTVVREPQEATFELVLAVGVSTRVPWLEFTVEAIFPPFERDAEPELEFEANLVWLPAERTRGWVTSHFDIVDKYSPAERPGDRRAYTHKLNFELDTSVAIFNGLREGRWLRGVELEGSLDYVATGLIRAGDDIAEVGRYLDDASPWSFAIVLIVPVATH